MTTQESIEAKVVGKGDSRGRKPRSSQSASSILPPSKIKPEPSDTSKHPEMATTTTKHIFQGPASVEAIAAPLIDMKSNKIFGIPLFYSISKKTGEPRFFTVAKTDDEMGELRRVYIKRPMQFFKTPWKTKIDYNIATYNIEMAAHEALTNNERLLDRVTSFNREELAYMKTLFKDKRYDILKHRYTCYDLYTKQTLQLLFNLPGVFFLKFLLKMLKCKNKNLVNFVMDYVTTTTEADRNVAALLFSRITAHKSYSFDFLSLLKKVGNLKPEVSELINSLLLTSRSLEDAKPEQVKGDIEMLKTLKGKARLEAIDTILVNRSFCHIRQVIDALAETKYNITVALTKSYEDVGLKMRLALCYMARSPAFAVAYLLSNCLRQDNVLCESVVQHLVSVYDTPMMGEVKAAFKEITNAELQDTIRSSLVGNFRLICEKLVSFNGNLIVTPTHKNYV